MATKIKGGTRGTLYKLLATMRLEDASILLKHKRYHGALYLAGYAVECALKWAITRRENAIYLPANLEIHGLDRLLQASGLQPGLKEDKAVFACYSALVDDWGPDGRYAAGMLDAHEALRLYKQINQVYQWINENAL